MSAYSGADATSVTALAIANTPGSPDETTTTVEPLRARSRANAARSDSTRLSDAVLALARRGPAARSTYGP